MVAEIPTVDKSPDTPTTPGRSWRRLDVPGPPSSRMPSPDPVHLEEFFNVLREERERLARDLDAIRAVSNLPWGLPPPAVQPSELADLDRLTEEIVYLDRLVEELGHAIGRSLTDSIGDERR